MDMLLEQFHDLILCITSALEERDPYTSFHSSRVAEMTQALCSYLKINAREAEVYHIAAHLHDIGKIGIRDNVLLKADRLTDEEWAIMKTHPVAGWRMLNGVRHFEGIAAVVRSHHERYDGKGYPDGLKGDEIPRGARIIAVADSIDAMLSSRPYRSGLTKEQCLSEIKKNSGIMYDPIVAECAILHFDDLLARREQAKGFANE